RRIKKPEVSAGHPWPPGPSDAQMKWWQELMRDSYPPVPVAEVDAKNDVAGFIYTGGTTGLSKGAMLTHYNLVANVMQGASWFPDLVDGKEAAMCVIPFFHSFGMTVAMNIGIYKAAKLILEVR